MNIDALAREYGQESFADCAAHKGPNTSPLDWLCSSCGAGQVELIKYSALKEEAESQMSHSAAPLISNGYKLERAGWRPGAWSGTDFFLAAIACLVLVGILVFIYMAIIKPKGTLTHIYRKRGLNDPALPDTDGRAPNGSDVKSCPDCAEEIRAAATICRYCRHDFGQPQN